MSYPAVAERRTVAPIMLVTAAILWMMSLRSVDVEHMTDTGLASVLPVVYFLSLALVTASFVLLLRRQETPVGLLALHVGLVVLIIHATPAILYDTVRYSWSWKHIGLIDYIQRHGTVDPHSPYLDAYHNWPGFFALGAILTEVAGLGSAVGIAAWGSVVFNLLFVGSLVLVFGALTNDRRIVWASVWLFELTNWVAQDYFAPQALNYFWYLVVVGSSLRWLGTPDAGHSGAALAVRRMGKRVLGLLEHGEQQRAAPPEHPASPAQQACLMLALVVVMAAIASSHQLTPFMTILALTALVLFGRLRRRSLPLIMAALTIGWLVTGAAAFVRSNLPDIVASFGRIEGNASSTLIDLSKASSGQVFVARADRLLTGFILLLGLAGALWQWRRGRRPITASVLFAAPFSLLAASSYGGEMLFRVYFFALPFAAYFAATLVFGDRRPRPSALRSLAALAVSGLLLAGLLFAYYGKERMYHFTNDEVQWADAVYGRAPAGAEMISFTVNYPWAFRDYERYSYLFLSLEPRQSTEDLLRRPVDKLAELIADPTFTTTYLVVTQSQIAEADMTGSLPRGSIQRMERELAASGRFRTLVNTRGARVWILAGGRGSGGS